MCNGNFMNKDPDDAFDFIDEITEKSQNWTPSESSHIIVQKTKVSANASGNGIDRLKEEDGLKAQIAKIAREVETLNSKLLHGINSVSSEEKFNICEICEVIGHATKECPTLPVFRNMLHDHANYINQFKKSSLSPCSETYNPQWKNHPNFSWKNNFNDNVPKKEPNFSSYSPQMQGQSSQLQSLEGVLKQFMQRQNATNKRTAQAIGEIKNILSKLTSALSVDEEGKFPAQTQPNLVGQFEVNIPSNSFSLPDNKHDQVKVVTTPQSRRIIGLENSTNVEKEKNFEIPKNSEDNIKENNYGILKYPSFVPFPQALKAVKKDLNSEILEVFKQVKINIPLLDTIKQIPSYAKFLKDLCTVKRKHNVQKTAFLTENVSAIIQTNTPPKYKDPGCPTISCVVGNFYVEHALLDLGASVNLMLYSVYKQLGLGELKPTSVTLQLADRSVKIP
ncbi:uncharacterized protein LOC110773522 [Prunus avium]|uniref:Uncharacterized protein LOC110773522 n=1 Tax=Prunus avium TaxID=42229 RepID=A0A6P5U317_PRUAV|nr:uncharacterized protein LOC110773522 [Prunus avium]